ncbi:MAG TPA: PKD domain-containing protein [Bacteroidia bacterium]|jgi:PKD repeat protein/photosystem II stability/assembly factor-like uncharacterized protein
MKRTLLLLSFLLFGLFKLSAQWSIVNVGTTQDLYSVDYYSSNDIWIGSFNQFVKTNNSGSNWTVTAPLKDASNITIQPANIYDIAVTGPSSAIATGFYLMGNVEYVLSTTNGGTNWNYAHSNNSGTLPRYMNSVDAWGTRAVAVGNTGRMVKSSTSGATWSYVFPNPTTTLISDVKFGTFDTVYAAGTNKVLRSVDGGVTWTSQTISGSFMTVGCDRGVVYIGNSAAQTMLKSVDYGVTYTSVALPFAYSGVLCAVNKDTVLAAGNTGVYVTFNGGGSWEMYDLPSYQNVKMFDFLTDTKGIAVGMGGYVLKTDNLAACPSLPISSFNIQGGISSICSGDSITLLNTTAPVSGYTYNWRLNGVSFSTLYNTGIRIVSNTGPQSVSLTVSNASGSTTFSRTVNVTGHDMAPLMFTAEADTICTGNRTGFFLAASQTGVTYQLRKGFTNIGTVQSGNGNTLLFQYSTALTSSTVFNIKAVRTTSCFTDSLVQYKTIYVQPSAGLTGSCVPFVNSCPSVGVTNVTIGQINNTSSTQFHNYFDYTCCHQSDLVMGVAHPISITTTNSSGEYVNVWIDYNKNGSFTDASELVLSGFANPTFSSNINIPATAMVFNQKLRMRIASAYDDDALLNPCFASSFYCAQVEDYSITILPAPVPPTPSFTFTSTTACAATATFTNTTYNGTSYVWDFGDGSAVITTQNASHVYTATGTYAVTLTATNSYGSNSVTNNIIVNIPLVPVPASCNPTFAACSGRPLISRVEQIGGPMYTSLGTANNYTCTGQFHLMEDSVYTFALGGNGNNNYFIPYLDANNDGVFSATESLFPGTQNVQNVGVTGYSPLAYFNMPRNGVDSVPLRMRLIMHTSFIMNSGQCSALCGDYKDFTVFLTPHPLSVLFHTNTPAVCGDSSGTVTFINNSRGETSYLWDFGDGTTSTVESPSHTYTSFGTFTVKLIVSNGVSTDSLIRTNYITIKPRLSIPVVTFNNGILTTTSVAPTYQWYRNNVVISGATSSSFTPTLDGTYKLVITNTNGCASTSLNYSHFPVHPNFTCSPTTICGSSTYTMFNNTSTNATSYTIYWGDGGTHTYGGSGAPIHTYNTPGVYTVKLKACNANGQCDSLVRSNYITINAPLSTPVITLSGNQLSTNTVASAYQWYRNNVIISGATSASYTATLTGTYKVVVSNGNCTATSANFSYFPVQVGFTAPVTSGCSSGTLSFTNSSTNATSYFWDFGDGGTSILTSPSHSYTSAGTYSVKLRACNSLGCDSLIKPSYITINQSPTVTNATTVSACSGSLDTIPLSSSVSGSSFNWTVTSMTGASGATSGSGANISQVITNTGGMPGTVVYLVTATSGGCTGPGTNITLTVNQPPSASISAAGALTFCAGDSVSLTSSSAISYLWSNGATTQNVTVSSSAMISVTVTDINGCDSTSSVTQVIVNPLPAPAIVPSGSVTLCAGDSISLDAGSGYASYLWSDGSTSSVLVVTSSGSDSVTVTDMNGCTDTSEPVTIAVIPVPVLIVTDPLPVCAPATADISDPAVTSGSSAGTLSYWQDSSGLIPLNSPDYSVIDSSATFFIRLENGACSVIEPVNVSIDRHCVWPGDANNDLSVNNYDLLPIGLSYSQSGPARSIVSNNWQGFASADWGTNQSNGQDTKHVDCNGDGLIDSNDTLAVNLNFSSFHTLMPQIPLSRTTDPYLYFVSNASTYLPGDWVDIDIMAGTNTTPVNDLYGIAFNINYNAALVEPGTESLFYPVSWLGNPAADIIRFEKMEPVMNTAYGAESRIDHAGRDGFGKIATLRFQAGTSITSVVALNFSFSGYSANDSAGNILLLNDSALSIVIDPTATSITESNSSSNINVYPNPYSDHTNISYVLNEKSEVNLEVYNALGQHVLTLVTQTQPKGSYAYNFSAKRSGMEAGVYFIRLAIDGKITMKRIVEIK